MKHNVDLTVDREFNKEGIMQRKHLHCEECGQPIQIPWKDFCIRCERFMNAIIFRKAACYLQLGYEKRIALKMSLHRQFLDDRWYYSEDSRKKCRSQLTGVWNVRPEKKPCRDQLSN